MRRSRRLLAALSGVAVLAALAVSLAVVSQPASPKGRVSPPQRPSSYRVLYRTDTWPYGQDLARWELLTVDRPFDSADLTYDAPPASGAAPLSGYVSTEEALYDVDAGLHLVAGRQPGVASADQDLLTQMPVMEARGLATDTGSVLHVAGLPCRVYRLYEPPAGPIKPLAGGSDHDDICLEANGLILAEAWTYQSHLVYSRRALEVGLGGAGPPPTFGGATPAPAGAPVLRADPSPRSFLVPPPVPGGFRAAGTYDFVVPPGQGQQVAQESSVVWVFVDGPDVVTVEAGNTGGGVPPWDGEKTVVRAVRLPGFADARSAVRSDGAEVRIDAGGGNWVRVRGTVPVSWLVRYATWLRMAS